MRKTITLLAVLLCLWPLASCDLIPVGSPSAADKTTSAPQATDTSEEQPSAAAPTEEPTAAPTPQPTAKRPLSDDVYAYFERVGYGGKGAVAKWSAPIHILVTGNPTDGDRAALNSLIGTLRTVEGMPEILLVTEGGSIGIGFVPMGSGREFDAHYNGKDAAAVSLDWGRGASASAHIIITDELADQKSRDASLSAMLFRALGLAVDAKSEHSDSVLAAKATATRPSKLDWLMLELLYSPEIKPGMKPEQALPILSTLDPKLTTGSANADDSAYSAGDMLSYFNEVGFYWAEKARDGIASKWSVPVKLQITGTPPAGFQDLIDQYVSQLNTTEGFPGIAAVQSGGNLTVNFATHQQLQKAYPKLTTAEACYYKLERGKNGAIARCAISLATDFQDEASARSQFLRLLIWSMGMNFTSDTWPDSILNYKANAQDWSVLDWSVIKLLYRSDIQPGAKRTDVMAALVKVVK